MPKRSAREKIDYYREKIKKLEETAPRKRRRVVIYTSSSEDDIQRDIEEISPIPAEVTLHDDQSPSPATCEELPAQAANPTSENTDIVEPVIDPDLLLALGDAITEVPVYGEKIHSDLAQRWLPILRKGLSEEVKSKLLKSIAIRENCKLLKAPSLNREIEAAITDAAKARDKKIEENQQCLGLGITAINRAMSILLTCDNKSQALTYLSEASRVLCDLHCKETQARQKLVSGGLDKSFLNIIQDTDRAESLFGNDLPEKIKAAKAIEKHGTQIKKIDLKAMTLQPSPRPAYKDRYQGNSRTPSRSTNRGRGGAKKAPMPTARRGGHHSYNSPRPWTSKYQQRAPTQR